MKMRNNLTNAPVQTSQVVCEQNKSCRCCVLRFRDDVIEARHREEEAEGGQHVRILRETRPDAHSCYSTHSRQISVQDNAN